MDYIHALSFHLNYKTRGKRNLRNIIDKQTEVKSE